MVTKVFSSRNPFCEVVRDSETREYYLIALCAGIAWAHVGIKMSEKEVADFRADARSVEGIAKMMCYDFTPFRARAISEAERDHLLTATK
jgi:hypothetical protein